MTTIKQSNRGIKFITSSQRRYYVTLTLPQCCKEPQMWTIGGSAVKFLFRCLKVVKNQYEYIFLLGNNALGQTSTTQLCS